MLTHPNAKINLGLNVLRKRADGYHDLETLFVPCMELTDTLEIVTDEDYSQTAASLKAAYPDVVQDIAAEGRVMITIARKGGVGWDPRKDLTVKAYELLEKDFDLPAVRIFLEKRISVGAGLGGGSADGAFALRMIAELAGLGLKDADLAAYAARLGSDCAFFIYNRPMFGSGRGECLEDFPLDLSPYRIELFIPESVSVPTAAAYRGIVPKEPDKPLKAILAQRPEIWKTELKNDFEETVFAAYPALRGIKERLYAQGALYAAMSGSGSAFFAIYQR